MRAASRLSSLVLVAGLTAPRALAGRVGSASGVIATAFGYPALFVGSGLLGLRMLGWVVRYFRLADRAKVMTNS